MAESTPPPPPVVWLASQSPRRLHLLAQLGVIAQTLLPDSDEDAEALEAERPNETPTDYVQRVTRAKLEAARRRHRQRGLAPGLLLCADTTVALEGRILGKPADADAARATLRALSGRAHWVHTAVAVCRVPDEGTEQTAALALSSTQVVFAPLSDALIATYIASGEPFGKAGAYAIQGALAGWVARIDGSHSGVMGLPLHETRSLLQRLGGRTALG